MGTPGYQGLITPQEGQVAFNGIFSYNQRALVPFLAFYYRDIFMPIVLLENDLINQIAAGEVVERPASVVKELVENALDAGASHITVTLRQGGQSLICVEDNGEGMGPEDLQLAIQRHTTSKLPFRDLWSIQTFGFRGEALASICSIARVTLKSCRAQDPHGWSLQVEAGTVTALTPTPFFKGTVVEVRDLFFAIPARLKFMRSAAIEQAHSLEVIEKLALMHPGVTFHIQIEHRKRTYPAVATLKERVAQIMGGEFIENALAVEGEKDGYGLKGWIGLPTYHRAAADKQLFFANGRAIKDKILSACLRAAFLDVTPRERFPVGILFLTVPTRDLDVNVHPAKTEVRFRDNQFVRNWVLSHLKQALYAHSPKVTTAWTPRFSPPVFIPSAFVAQETTTPGMLIQSPLPSLAKEALLIKERSPIIKEPQPMAASILPPTDEAEQRSCSLDLGIALGQIHNSFIVAQNARGLVIVDPHAAHERILYESMKAAWANSLGEVQLFLLSVPVTLSPAEAEEIARYQEALGQLGLQVTLREEECEIQSVPAIFKDIDPVALLKDVLAVLAQGLHSTPHEALEEIRNTLMGNWACRKSIFLGQSLTIPEMNALLRQIEQTPHGAQCNHGRPVYREISLEELSRFFERH